ncbi:hypothetical protein D3C81_2225240 [compost metagenome]
MLSRIRAVTIEGEEIDFSLCNKLHIAFFDLGINVIFTPVALDKSVIFTVGIQVIPYFFR